MKRLFLLILPLVALSFTSCDKGETPKPDFHQTYTMQCQKSHLEDGLKVIDCTEIVQVNLSFVNFVITVSFTMDDENCLYTYTKGNYEVYTDSFSVWNENDRHGGVFKRYIQQVGNYFDHDRSDGYTFTLR